MLDLLIRGGTVLDGTGAPGRRADVAVAGGRIAAVEPPGALDGAELRAGPDRRTGARRVLDATGKVVCPGFLDLHSHSELALLLDPFNRPKLEQGFTFELLGQDGLSVAPLSARTRDDTRRALAGLLGDPPEVDWSWRSVADFLERLDGRGLSAGYLVPHGQVRREVMGGDDRPPTADELTAMRRLVRQGLAEGAFGFSTGLIYPPGSYAATAELVAFGEEVAAAGGIFVVHLRSEGTRILEAVDEMLEVARRSGCAVHISHLKLSGRPNWGKLEVLVGRLTAARRAGLDVTVDQYPYAAGSTVMTALLPAWALAGGPAAVLRRLDDAAERARIAAAMVELAAETGETFDGVVVSDLQTGRPELAALVGRPLPEIAAALGVDPATAVLDLLRETRLGAAVVLHTQAEPVVRALMRLPFRSVGTDGLLVAGAPAAADGGRGLAEPAGSRGQRGRPHPRAYGTAPRLLGHYARDERVVSLEEAVHSLTGRPAARLGLDDRGRIAPGLRADLVVFDPATVIDRATYERPTERPAGIEWVVVGGEVVVERGAVLPSAPRRGEAIRSRRRG